MNDFVIEHALDRHTSAYDYDTTMELLELLANDPDSETEREVTRLLAARADPNGDSGEETVLMRALELHSETVVRQLVQAGARVNDIDGDGRTPLMFVLSHLPEWAPLLLELGAKPMLGNEEGVTPLHVAAEAMHNPFAAVLALENIRGLLAAGADAAARTVEGEQPLHRLLALPEPPAPDAEEHASLLRAAVVLLAEAKAPLHEPGAARRLPLTCASALGLHGVVHELVQRGAPLRAGSGENGSALHAAFTKADVDFLVRMGARVDAGDWQGNTPLHRVSTVAAARALLDHGADLAARNRHGETPLICAAKRLASRRDLGPAAPSRQFEAAVVGTLYAAGHPSLLDLPDAGRDPSTSPRHVLRSAVVAEIADSEAIDYIQAFLARVAALDALQPQAPRRVAQARSA